MSRLSDFDHGPLRTYELIYRSGHIERVQGHQVIWPQSRHDFFGTVTKTGEHDHVLIHGEIDGQWLLVLAADVDDVQSVRLVLAEERIDGGAS